jgi:hypothetical protein
LLRLPVIGDNAAMEAESKHNRRWFQFSLGLWLLLRELPA